MNLLLYIRAAEEFLTPYIIMTQECIGIWDRIAYYGEHSNEPFHACRHQV